MNVFVIGSPLETAKCLDTRRLNKQIIECKQILKAINGETKAWANHPATLQYKNNVCWLQCYMWCLECYKEGNIEFASFFDEVSKKHTPKWHIYEYFTQMKRRLYTKNNNYYFQWKELGESDINMYYVDGMWRYYQNGKQIKTSINNFLIKNI